ncbi:DUF4399 domain-containing protein [Undibacterium arcticum]|uniref:DUF4399 domain-containing protein n=1 Tax=Undibacterium arcticum TaxID=1762892 RepID=UPI0036190BE9
MYCRLFPSTGDGRAFRQGETETLPELPPGKHTLRLLFADHKSVPYYIRRTSSTHIADFSPNTIAPIGVRLPGTVRANINRQARPAVCRRPGEILLTLSFMQARIAPAPLLASLPIMLSAAQVRLN